MTKTQNGLENGLANRLEETCLKTLLTMEIHCRDLKQASKQDFKPILNPMIIGRPK